MNPRVRIKKKRTKESIAEMKVQWDSSVVPRIYMIEKEEKKKRTKESIAEMKVQWDSSVVPRIYMIEKEENLKTTIYKWE